MIDAVQSGRDQRGDREVRVHVAAGNAVLDAQRVAVADDAQRAGAVVHDPTRTRRRRERCRLVALVRVDVRREEAGDSSRSVAS